jgi:hypothetical protein
MGNQSRKQKQKGDKVAVQLATQDGTMNVDDVAAAAHQQDKPKDVMSPKSAATKKQQKQQQQKKKGRDDAIQSNTDEGTRTVDAIVPVANQQDQPSINIVGKQQKNRKHKKKRGNDVIQSTMEEETTVVAAAANQQDQPSKDIIATTSSATGKQHKKQKQNKKGGNDDGITPKSDAKGITDVHASLQEPPLVRDEQETSMPVADLAPSVPPNKKAKTAQQRSGKKAEGNVATPAQQEGMVLSPPVRSTRSTVGNLSVQRTNASSIANQPHDTDDVHDGTVPEEPPAMDESLVDRVFYDSPFNIYNRFLPINNWIADTLQTSYNTTGERRKIPMNKNDFDWCRPSVTSAGRDDAMEVYDEKYNTSTGGLQSSYKTLSTTEFAVPKSIEDNVGAIFKTHDSVMSHELCNIRQSTQWLIKQVNKLLMKRRTICWRTPLNHFENWRTSHRVLVKKLLLRSSCKKVC